MLNTRELIKVLQTIDPKGTEVTHEGYFVDQLIEDALIKNPKLEITAEDKETQEWIRIEAKKIKKSMGL